MVHAPQIRLLAALVLILGTGALPVRGSAVDMPPRATLEQLRALPAVLDRAPAQGPVLLVAPTAPDAARDPRENAAYRAVVYAYVSDGGEWVRRFAVHAPEAGYAPFARNVARHAAAVWRTADRRLGPGIARLRSRTLHIWLTRAGDGAVTERENVYIMGITHERSGLEWLREVAHEYGHYALPGASGYDEPEPWANGLLGERLLLGWMAQDLRMGLLAPEDLPGVTSADLDEYVARQVTPLLERSRRAPPEARLLAPRTAQAADAFTALMLWADATYGPSAITGLLDFLPQGADASARGSDFLDALQAWVRAASEFTTTVQAPGARVYVPRGAYLVSAPDVRAVEVSGAACSRQGSVWLVRSPAAGWRSIRVTGAPTPAVLRWRRQ